LYFSEAVLPSYKQNLSKLLACLNCTSGNHKAHTLLLQVVSYMTDSTQNGRGILFYHHLVARSCTVTNGGMGEL
jgi:hypothetical protein